MKKKEMKEKIKELENEIYYLKNRVGSLEIAVQDYHYDHGSKIFNIPDQEPVKKPWWEKW